MRRHLRQASPPSGLDVALLDRAARRGRTPATSGWQSDPLPSVRSFDSGWASSRVSVVIPALNEARNLSYVLPRIPAEIYEIVLVDGHSTDETCELAPRLRPGVRVIEQDGAGKGAALRTGFAACSGEIIVMLDADGSTDPAEIPLFVGALLAGADYAKGSRFLQGGGTSDMPLYRRFGNRVLVRVVRLFFGSRYSDLCYGYNAFWADVVERLDLHADGFEIETLMNIRALRVGLKVVEVPSFEYQRRYGTGYLRTMPDGWRVLKTVLGERFGQSGRLRAPIFDAELPEALAPGAALLIGAASDHDEVNERVATHERFPTVEAT